MNFQDHAHFRVLPASPAQLISNTKIRGSSPAGPSGGAMSRAMLIPLSHYTKLYDQHQFQALTELARTQLSSREAIGSFLLFARLSLSLSCYGISIKNKNALEDFRTRVVLNFSLLVRNAQRCRSCLLNGSLRTNISTFYANDMICLDVSHSLIKQ